MNLFSSGIRPAIDTWLLEESRKKRDYGEFWSASQAGYCMRKVIFDRLGVPPVKENARKQRVFTSGHLFHEWIQGITKETGLSIAQELELQDEELMIRGHIDDLVLVTGNETLTGKEFIKGGKPFKLDQHLILYDYKTVNSKSFGYKRDEMSHYHKYQLGTYMYMLRKGLGVFNKFDHDHLPEGSKNVVTVYESEVGQVKINDLTEARILKIEKDTLRMSEEQLLWTPELEKEVVAYWTTLNEYWKTRKLPKCTCDKYEGGFLAKEKWNPYFFKGKPCSLEWLKHCKKEGVIK